ncbi:unnamed protein product [Allacma fusca]|uniref:Peptidase M14 domain-containing protein n=1 Tax=Allacma fusca TaxID=39272 RepID=A0A8J2Q253_9HEXA|nr:unnamed protein product [Allacma fusca]
MWIILVAFFCLPLKFVDVQAGLISYDGHEVIRTYPADQEQMQMLGKLRENFDFWSEPKIGGPTDIRVGGNRKTMLRNFLKQKGIKYDVYISDLQDRISREREQLKRSNTMDWTSYHSASDINMWLESLAFNYPDIATVYDIGTSTEGRPIRLIHIGIPRTSGPLKQGYWIDGGMHAREWVGPAVATWVINELVTNSDQYQDMLTEIDFYIVPIVNVDGYEYSRTKDRLWRKTRSNHKSRAGCLGVDPNRNFDYFWGGEGTSSDKCSEIYKGPTPFSEPETAAMRDYITKISGKTVNWVTYIALHSYAQMILTPWGYETNLYPEDYAELKQVADEAASALTACYGTHYDVGAAGTILYPAAGASDDWSKGSGYFRLVYTFEVRDTGRYGFLLPADQIIPTAIETWAALKVFGRHMTEKK